MPEQSHTASQGKGCVMTVISILAAYQILFACRVLIDNGVKADLLYFAPSLQAFIAIIWALLFTHAAFRLQAHQANALRYSAWLVICFIVSDLLQIALFAQADYDRNRIGFLLVVTLMIFTVPILLLLRQSNHGTQK